MMVFVAPITACLVLQKCMSLSLHGNAAHTEPRRLRLFMAHRAMLSLSLHGTQSHVVSVASWHTEPRCL